MTESSANSADPSAVRLSTAGVTDMLMGTWGASRRQAREMVKNPELWRDDSLGKDEHRKRVMKQALGAVN